MAPRHWWDAIFIFWLLVPSFPNERGEMNRSSLTAAKIIQLFDLKPHPEGGHYRETYRAVEKISKSALPSRFVGDCAFSTAIYYLLAEGEKSKLHRLKTDELFHFYLGDPLIVVQIFPDRVEKVTLGQDILTDEKVQHLIPAGCWFGGYPAKGSRFSFIGCTVAPGFDFADFETANTKRLLNDFPHAKEEILKMR